MPTWNHYASVFPTAQQAIAQSVEYTFTNSFSQSSFTAFANLEHAEIKADLLTLGNEDELVSEIAQFILAQLGTLGEGDDWEDFAALFSAPDLAYIEALIAYYEASTKTVEDILETTSPDVAINIIAAASANDFWDPYSTMLLYRVAETQADPWLNFADSMTEEEADEAEGFILDLQDSGAVLSFWQFTELSIETLTDKIANFPSSGDYETALADTLSAKANEIWDALSPNAPTPTPEYWEEYISAFPSQKQPAIRQFITNVVDDATFVTLEELAGTDASNLIDYFNPDPESPVFYQLLSDYYLGKAGVTLGKVCTPRRFVGQLAQASTGELLTGFKVVASESNDNSYTRQLGYTFSQGKGYFEIEYNTFGLPTSYTLDFSIYGPYDVTPLTASENADPNEVIVTQILVTPASGSTTSASIAGLALSIEFTPSSTLNTYLGANSISSLSNIREIGGLKNQEDLTVDPTDAEIVLLDGLAQLELISDDVVNNETLIGRGYDSLGKIARMERFDFVTENEDLFGNYLTAQLHVAASASHKVLLSVIGNTGAHRGDSFSQTVLENALPQNCNCEDCQSGVSPLAYLADLLNYTLVHVKNNGSAITLSDLQSTFHQPYADLTTSCSAAKETICQVRIATEVLRSYYTTISGSRTTNQLNQLAAAEESYRLNSYQLLLNALGSDYDEIRLARNWSVEEREALAHKLGITLGTGNPDELEQLFLDPAQNEVTESALESLFGLRDTNRDPVTATPVSSMETWRKARLREIWQELDFPSDPFEDGDLPVVDPDVIGPDDFRKPSATNEPFDTWKIRQDWVASEMDAFAGIVKARGIYPGTQTFEIYGKDLSSYISGSTGVEVIDSTGNDNTYVIGLTKVVDGNTLVTIDNSGSNASIQDSTADGYLVFGANQTIIEYPNTDEITISGDVTADFNSSPKIAYVWLVNSSESTYNDVFPVISATLSGTDTILQVGGSANFNTQNPTTPGDLYYAESLEGPQIPDFDSIFSKMENTSTAQFGYNSGTPITPWDGSKTSADFDTMASDLALGINVDTVEAELKSELFLSVDAFSRLYELWQKDVVANNNPDQDRLTDEEWQEVYSILLQSVKEQFYGVWISEEGTAGIKINPTDFWPSLTEPKGGVWPPFQETGVPLVDPELVSKKEIADHEIDGIDGADLWEQRKATLEQNFQTIKDDYDDPLNKFDDVVENALSQASSYDLDDLLDNLDGTDEDLAQAALENIENDLYMNEAEFRRMMEIREKAYDFNPSNKPGQDELREVFAILTTAQKKDSLYSTWIAYESSNSIQFLHVRKQNLPKWRGEALARVTWQLALSKWSEAPIIDPDLIGPGDLVDPSTSNDAYIIWATRRSWMNTVLSVISGFNTGGTGPGMIAIISGTLGISITDFEALGEQEANGVDIRPRLRQLNLSRNAYQALVELYDLSQQSSPVVLDEEWDEAYAILCQVIKEREYAAWRREEAGTPLHLGPDWFKLLDPPQLTFPPELPHPLPKWLGDERARRLWQRTLENRIESEAETVAALKSVAQRVSEAMLPKLRDALIRVTGSESTAFKSKVKTLTDAFLIDLENNCCQGVTRVSMAIETLQSLLWSLRTAQLNDTYPDLDLLAAQFDEEWKWIGSYATWRSAVFVFLYPENILMPSLKRYQSPAFREVSEALRGNRGLTSEAACRIAKGYSDYLRDVCNLEVKATVQTLTWLERKSCSNSGTYSSLLHMFAQSSKTGKVYWSWVDTQTSGDKDRSFWQEVPGLENVVEICGATAYQLNSSERYIYLFADSLEGEEQKLKFTRYNLVNLLWDGDWTELELPEACEAFKAVVKQSSEESKPPSLAIQADAGVIYGRSINTDGNDWEEEDWMMYSVKHFDWRTQILNSFLRVDSGDEVLVVTFFENGVPHLMFRMIGRKDDGFFRRIEYDANFKGAIFWEGSNDFLVVYEKYGTVHSQLIFTSFTPSYTNISDTIGNANLKDLEGHFQRLAGVGLSDISAKEALGESDKGSPLYYYLQNKLSTSQEKANAGHTSGIYIDDSLASEDSIKGKKWKYLSQETSRLTADKFSAGEMVSRYLSNSLGTNGISFIVSKPYAFEFNDFLSNSTSNPNQPTTPKAWLIGVNIPFNNSLKSLPTIGGKTYGPPVSRDYIANLNNSNGGVSLVELSRNTINEVSMSIGSVSNRLVPDLTSLFSIPVGLSENELQLRKTHLQNVLLTNAAYHAIIQEYLWEAFYFVPMSLAIALARKGEFIRALDWFRTVYDYSQLTTNRKIFYGLKQEESLPFAFNRSVEWLNDPLNPHAIARSRANTYTRFTLLSIVRAMLDYADSEFTLDTSETVPKARILYETALELLALLQKSPTPCEDIIGSMGIEISDPYWIPVWEHLTADLHKISDPAVLEELTADIITAMAAAGNEAEGVQAARTLVDTALASLPSAPGFADKLDDGFTATDTTAFRMMADGSLLDGLGTVSSRAKEQFEQAVWLVTGYSTTALEAGTVDLPWLALPGAAEPDQGGQDTWLTTLRREDPFRGGLTNIMATLAKGDPHGALEMVGYAGSQYVPGLALTFCIPQNPILQGLYLRAILNLYKIHNCLNIAGVKRQIEPYAAPTDTVSGLPTIGAGGQLVLPGNTTYPPTQYRYKVLVERARQLVGIAQQIEAAFLSTLEKRDAEAYSMMRAKQDLELSKAGVRLQQLRVKEAEHGVDLVELQKDKVEFTRDHFEELIDIGKTAAEITSLTLLKAAAISQALSTTSFLAAGGFSFKVDDKFENYARAFGSISSTLSTISNVYSQIASFERRQQDWQFQKELAGYDLDIANQQITLANDRVRISGQEHQIAEMQSDNAKATVDFLQNKFTNVELYDWMSGVLEDVYGYFLREATAMAKLAEVQLAFERQETPPPYIQQDYWEVPAEGASSDPNQPGTDRRGLTGSARLLRDLYQLDQYAFQTDQRKLQLTKTISLAQMSPMEFQQLRESGVMTFATPMELFDRDFPGHYLRLIKRIRTTVVALVPPIDGIKATLTHNGLSRVTVGGDIFQTALVRRDPEQIALSSAYNATGLFEMQPENEFLNPFEGNGVDGVWEFRMEKAANRFDYDTLADVLVTIEYEALNDFSYRQQVVRTLGTEFSGDRPFSFKNNFPDQWYDLQNPTLTNTPMTVKFKTSRQDFPANLSDLTIKHLVLYLVREDGGTQEITNLSLTFTPDPTPGNQGSLTVGGTADTVDGVVSTRRGNAGSWLAITGLSKPTVSGTWELKLPSAGQVPTWFAEEQIEDILFVITYEGETPKWI
ncbi:MAG: hypothetical protein H6581_31120 [Bacteroidia bacterium]|nr:hypothetical protein [Bacteroidia bacterium]